MNPITRSFRAFEAGNFRLYITGVALAQTAYWVQLIGLTVLVLDRTDNGVAVGLINVAQFGPFVLAGLWAGVLIDRFDRWRMLLIDQLLAVTVAVVMVIGSLSAAPIWLFYALATVNGFIRTVDIPTRKTLLSDVVRPAHISNAVGLSSAVAMAAKVVGPAVAGIIIAGAGLTWSFGAAVMLFVAAFVTLLVLDRSAMPVTQPIPRAPGQVREGIAYAWKQFDIRLPLLIVGGIGTLSFNFQVILPLFASRDLLGGESLYAWMFSSMGLGSLIGALVVASRMRVEGRFLTSAAAGMAVATVVLAGAPNAAVAVAAALPIGVLSMCVLAGANSIVQIRAAPAMRGRVIALHALVFVATTPIGGPLLGAVSEHLGARFALVLGAAGSMLVAIAGRIALVRHEQRAGKQPVTVGAA